MTALSAGKTLRAILLSDADIASMVKVIAPVVVSPETRLPYITYRRIELESIPTKSGYCSSDHASIEVNCYAEDYNRSLRIAEAVRYALETPRPCPPEVPCPRSITMKSSEELYEGDAYIQSLVFLVSI